MYENLKVNRDRLSSPFDIHQTLMDILKIPEDLTLEQANIQQIYIYYPICIRMLVFAPSRCYVLFPRLEIASKQESLHTGVHVLNGKMQLFQ